VVNSNGAPRNIEAIVVSDLEFLGLKRHPAYEHRAPVRELEEVPSEASGSLERNGENFIVVSESQAAVNAQRMAEIRAETLKRLNAMAEAQRTHQRVRSSVCEARANGSSYPKAGELVGSVYLSRCTVAQG